MRNKFIVMMVGVLAAASLMAGCGSNANTGSNTESGTNVESSSSTDSSSNEDSESSTVKASESQTVDYLEEGEHDATEKDNTFTADATAAADAGKGSTDTLSGRYQIKMSDGDVIEGAAYVFSDGNLTIEQGAEYSISDGKVSIAYAGSDPKEYEITETKAGFNLTQGEGTLIPLVYMEGTDGLDGSEPFDGVYSMADSSTGYVFNSDGTLTIISTQECEVDGDSVTFGGSTYGWEAKDGDIELGTNGTVVMTLVP